jgi:hypothetical protein
MAKQTSILTYSGKIGDKVGVKTKKGHFERSCPAHVNQTPATRRAAFRFGRASRTAAFIRKSFCTIADIRKDDGYINRLTKALIPSAGMNISSIAGYRFNKAKGVMATYRDGILHIPSQSGKEKLVINVITLRVHALARRVYEHSIAGITLDPGTGADIPICLHGPGTGIIALQINGSTEIIAVVEPITIQQPLSYPLPRSLSQLPVIHTATLYIQKE